MEIQAALTEMEGNKVIDAAILRGEPLVVSQAIADRTGVDPEDLMFDMIAAVIHSEGDSIVLGRGQVVKVL